MLPDGIFQFGSMFPSHVAIHLEKVRWPAGVAAESEAHAGPVRGIVVEQVAQIGMRYRRAQDQLDIQVAVARVGTRNRGRIESHHDIGVLALRTNEPLGVGLPFLQLLQHLLNRIAAFGRITLDLPVPPQFLRGSKKHLDVVELPHGSGVETQESFHDDKFTWLYVFRTHQRAGTMVIDGFEDWLAVVRALQVQLKDVDKVAVRMQGSDVET